MKPDDVYVKTAF